MYLNIHSYYSLRYGTLPVEKIAEMAAVYGIPVLPLTDINTTMGVFEFVRACRKHHIQPVAGADIFNGGRHLYTTLVRNITGFRELNEFLTRHNLSNTPFPAHPPEFRHIFIIYPPENIPDRPLELHEYLGIRLSMRQKRSLPLTSSRTVLLQPVTFADKEEYLIHKHLRAIHHNTLLSSLHPGQYASPDEIFLPPRELYKIMQDHPRILANTRTLLESCTFDFDFKTSKNKKTFTGNVQDDMLLLRKLAYDGMQYRYGKNCREAEKRILHELEIIGKMGFAAYFLITWDIIRYAMNRGFYHVGRGSGANSVIAYCLRITDVDPIELNLYFERFINPKRTSPPDFDIDFSWKERNEVLDYIFKRYGRKHTALLGAVSTFKGKSILRELGKVYGLPKSETDRLIRDPAAFRERDDITRAIFAVGSRIKDFPNLRTIHAGGVLISEEPITSYTALDLPPKGFPTTQWDMYTAENIGFEKLDILSQRGIGHIRECAEIVRSNRGITEDIHAVSRFKKDPLVRSFLRKGETLGCFYIESPAMRGLLKKIQCDTYPALVAASSIIRPGVARSGMMREYIRRFHNPHGFKYLHPVMKEQLKETYGIMVYQEDVLKVCHHFAGLDLADADVLRRAMSGKFRSREEMNKIVDKFFDNCRTRGYPDDLTREVWRQIESFAGYSFSKAHSASYAVESFQSLYLKAHYPLEFMVGVINNFGGFYPLWVYVNEARRYGGNIQLPCVNHSHYKTSISGKTLYLGFIHIKNLVSELARRITREREKNGPYRHLPDFYERLTPGPEQLQILIRSGAFRFTGKSRKQLLWEAYMLSGKKKENISPLRTLFPMSHKDFHLPALDDNNLEKAYDEMELLGFPVTLSWFDMLRTNFRGEIQAHDMLRHVGRKVRMAGLLVNIKYVHTLRNEWMHFAAWLDAQGNFFDTVHFPKMLKEYPFRGNGIYLLLGKVITEADFPSLKVEKMARLPFRKDER